MYVYLFLHSFQQVSSEFLVHDVIALDEHDEISPDVFESKIP